MARTKLYLRNVISGASYELDGWRLETLDAGTLLDLRLGQGYLIFALAAFTVTDPRWRLMLIDSAVFHVDEVDVREDYASFSCPRVTLPLPDRASLSVERGGEMRSVGLEEATFEASNTEELYILRLVLSDGGELRWRSDEGWRHTPAGQSQAGPCPEFTAHIEAMLH